MFSPVISYVAIAMLIGVIFCIKEVKRDSSNKDTPEDALLIASGIIGIFWPIYFALRIIAWICKRIYNIIYNFV